MTHFSGTALGKLQTGPAVRADNVHQPSHTWSCWANGTGIHTIGYGSLISKLLPLGSRKAISFSLIWQRKEFRPKKFVWDETKWCWWREWLIGKANVLPSADSIHHSLTEKVQTSTSSICLLTFSAKISQECLFPQFLHIFACQRQSSHETELSPENTEFCCEQIHWKGHQEISASDKHSCLHDEYNH